MATDFPKFSLLPTELRRKIWSFCMPENRVLEFDFPQMDILETTCTTSLTSIANAKPPIFSQVCREAHDVAFTEGGFLWDLPNLRKAKGLEELPEDDLDLIAEINNPWFCPKTDTVHLHWQQSYQELYDSDNKPFPALVAHAGISQGGSIMADVVLPFQDEFTYDCSGHPRGIMYDYWGFPRGIDFDGMTEALALERLSGFKTCLFVVIIHSTDTRVVDSGLFGSLAAPIQLVDAMDRETIRRMYELWWTTFDDDSKLKDSEPEKIFEEMVYTPDDFESRVCLWHEWFERTWLWNRWLDKFHEGTLNTISPPEDVFTGPKLGQKGTPLHPLDIHMPEQDFNKAHPWVQESLDVKPRFHPVIMFRYCSGNCYTLGRPKPPKWHSPWAPGIRLNLSSYLQITRLNLT
ncbi:hypothetical protein OCU04_009994 [Sclerotinia nivalis]|uniref:2EXR domain-containing protein n=1 Tax=Sclerotinia nivalis TaxID=352851 RepID=A0A9X0ADP4_9HELO|nr:hypothetical protein OCU04_009994 [Sclerotinia nivalis]